MAGIIKVIVAVVCVTVAMTFTGRKGDFAAGKGIKYWFYIIIVPLCKL